MNNYESMLKEKHRLKKELMLLQKTYQNKEWPEGRISFSKNGKTYKFYKQTPGKREYIPANRSDLIKELMNKRYYEDKISAIQKELRAIDTYVKLSPQDPDSLFINHPYFKTLVTNLQDSNYLEDLWTNSDYEKNINHPENLVIPTLKGDLVRSKSEAMIADELFRAGIPYRYEVKINIGKDFFYPDFIAKNRRTNQVFIWEHFGKMDDLHYIEHNCLYKLNRYLHSGYIPGINFITTYENLKNPFYPIKARQMIDLYLD